MILENEDTFLGGLFADVKEILGSLIGIAFLTLFVGFLVAPAMEPLVCSDLYKKCNTGTAEEMKRAYRRLKSTRRLLWVICVLSWLLLIATNVGFNLLHY